jgi:hypothetical protein
MVATDPVRLLALQMQLDRIDEDGLHCSPTGAGDESAVRRWCTGGSGYVTESWCHGDLVF